MKNKKLIGIIPLFVLSMVTTSCGMFKTDDEGNYDFKMTIIWNGLSYMNPENENENRIQKIITEKIGVTPKITWANGDETTNLNNIFSIGKNMPDVIMAPYWGGGDACSSIIRQAAKEELIVPVDSYLDSIAPNLKDAYSVGVAKNFVANELGVEEFAGKKYIIPMHTPSDNNNIQNWGYTVYGRKDILQDLGVDPNSIHTSEDLYQLSKKIKNGNYKDINGDPVIPASCWGNGWSYETYLNSFKTRNFTNIVNKGDHFEWIGDQQYVEDEVKFMFKMVSEGLFDKTAFSHSNDVAISKHVRGGVGLTSTQYPYIRNQLKNTLYATHPEMEYVPLGPIYNYNGEAIMPETCKQDGGYYGFAVLLITKDCKEPEKVMKYLNYINSEEGKYLVYLGEEGVDYTMKDGKPRMTDDFFAKQKANPSYMYDEGIESYMTFGVSRVPFNLFDDAKEETVDQTYKAVKEMYPITMKEGVLATSFDEEFEQIDQLHSVLQVMDYGTVIESAYCASTLDDALRKLSNYRTSISSGRYLKNYLDWLYEKIGSRTDILY